jgi:hypothetical protein
MKLKETQSANFYMIYNNIAQALIFAEDLHKDKTLDPHVKREVVIPILNKLNFLERALLLKTPQRQELKSHDHLRFAEINRKLALMSEESRNEFENLLP